MIMIGFDLVPIVQSVFGWLSGLVLEPYSTSGITTGIWNASSLKILPSTGGSLLGAGYWRWNVEMALCMSFQCKGVTLF